MFCNFNGCSILRLFKEILDFSLTVGAITNRPQDMDDASGRLIIAPTALSLPATCDEAIQDISLISHVCI